VNISAIQNVIVVPCFNEAKRWNLEYWEQFTSLSNTYLLFVDDGSTDGTHFYIARTLKRNRGEYFALNENQGKANAVRLGMLRAGKKFPNSKTISFLDADGSVSYSDVQRLISKDIPADFDSIWSSRANLSGRNIERTLLRHWISRSIATFFGFFFPYLPYDTQCGFKIFKNESTLIEALQNPFKTTWFFDLELITHFDNLRIWEEPLGCWREVSGSKIEKFHYLKIFKELVTVFVELRKYDIRISRIE